MLGPGSFWLRVLAPRPRKGMTPAQAKARLNAVWPQLSRALSRLEVRHRPARKKATGGDDLRISSWRNGLFIPPQHGSGEPLLVLMAVVSLVLLIACANVAFNLLLARSAARQRPKLPCGWPLAQGARESSANC